MIWMPATALRHEHRGKPTKQEEKPRSGRQRKARQVLEQAPFMKSLPVISRTFDNGLNDKISGYLIDAVNATIKGVAYDQAFSTAAKGVKQVFEEYKIE